MMQDRGSVVSFTDDNDWSELGLITGLAIVWGLALIPMWLAPEVPMWVALVFTLGGVILAQSVVYRISSSRTRIVSIDRVTGDMAIVFRTPLWWEETTVQPSKIEGVVFSTLDYETKWHKASLRINGKTVTFAQGAGHGEVRERFDRMCEVLEPFCPGLRVDETQS